MNVVYRKHTGNDMGFWRYGTLKAGKTLADLEANGIEDAYEVTEPKPDMEQLEEWTNDCVCEATDGCIVEPDGVCGHGHPSWLLALGMI